MIIELVHEGLKITVRNYDQCFIQAYGHTNVEIHFSSNCYAHIEWFRYAELSSLISILEDKFYS
jgi:hypothetical protein